MLLGTFYKSDLRGRSIDVSNRTKLTEVKDMHSTETRDKFLELRARGLSLARIAGKIGVSKRTLIDWNREHAEELRALRAVQLEAIQEKLMATTEGELSWMTQMLKRTEETLMETHLKYQSTGDVWRMQTWLRAEIAKRRISLESFLDIPLVPAPASDVRPAQPILPPSEPEPETPAVASVPAVPPPDPEILPMV